MLLEIWRSFRAMPLWVQIWVALILVPVNCASLLFAFDPMGGWIAFLAVGAMLPNLAIMWAERGFSKLMALPHLVPWTILVVILVFARPEGSGAYAAYLWVLLVVDFISLGFDYPDARAWLRGDRAVAGVDSRQRKSPGAWPGLSWVFGCVRLRIRAVPPD